MKDNFEKNIKESFDKFEMPYNHEAWKAMKSKLDVAKPVTGFKYKWFAAAVIGVGVIFGTYKLATYNSEKDQQIAKIENTASNLPTANDKGEKNQPIEQTENAPTCATESIKASESDDLAPQNNLLANRSSDDVSQTSDESNGLTTPSLTNQDSQNSSNQRVDTGTEGQTTPSDNEAGHNFIIPEVADQCEGSYVTINNRNERALAVEKPDGTIWMVEANLSGQVHAIEAGSYKIGHIYNGTFVSKGQFYVMEGPYANIHLTRRDEKYDDKGLPAVHLSTDATSNELKWTFDGRYNATGKDVIAQFYNKGQHKVSLEVKGANGCKTTIDQVISVEDDYNLLAVKSFVPTDVDPMNNRFMPFSLTVRGDQFRMIIIDPKDGHIMYETNDPSMGWDGIDSQTGQMVPYQTAYIWKVTIENPRPGETPEYAGTVIPLESRR
jgi:hypothetical protein